MAYILVKKKKFKKLLWLWNNNSGVTSLCYRSSAVQQLLEKNYRIHCSVHNIVSRKCSCSFIDLFSFKMSIFILVDLAWDYFVHSIGSLKDNIECITSTILTWILTGQCCCVSCGTDKSNFDYSTLSSNYWQLLLAITRIRFSSYRFLKAVDMCSLHNLK